MPLFLSLSLLFFSIARATHLASDAIIYTAKTETEKKKKQNNNKKCPYHLDPTHPCPFQKKRKKKKTEILSLSPPPFPPLFVCDSRSLIESERIRGPSCLVFFPLPFPFPCAAFPSV